ncbi:MAG: rhamnogalacturonan acetylesterase [Bacteroidota bacterium]
MKNKFTLMLILLATVILINATLPDKHIRIYMIGDSTMANKVPGVYPETGWGQVFNEYFDHHVVIDNRAQNGKSTKSFIAENRWKHIMDSLKAGDYVFIEFGHNDEKVDKPGVGATLEEYRTNLLRFVTDARSKQAIPVLMTPIMRRSFHAGIFHDTHGAYPEVVRALADEFKVAFIDMHQKSEKLLVTTGEEETKKMFNWADSGAYAGFPKGVKDNTHLNPVGAHKMAELAVEGIRELKLPLTKFLK